MPFTLSHVAAVLPAARLTRTKDARGRGGPLVASALVFGAMAPDAVLFVDLGMSRRDSHALVGGVLLADLLIVAALVAIWHVVLRGPLLALLPDRLCARLHDPLRPRLPGHLVAEARAGRPWAGAALAAGAWFVVSAWIGGLAHIGWDMWTHHDDYGVARIAPGLREPWIGGRSGFVLLQHLSTLVGLVVLAGWGWRRLGRLPELPRPGDPRLPVPVRVAVVTALVGAGAGVALRTALPLLPGDWFSQISHIGFDAATGFVRGCVPVLLLHAAAWHIRRARHRRRTAGCAGPYGPARAEPEAQAADA